MIKLRKNAKIPHRIAKSTPNASSHTVISAATTKFTRTRMAKKRATPCATCTT